MPMKENSTSDQIDDIIKIHGGWKAEKLAQLRAIINSADASVTEDVKWKMPTRPEGLPAWYSGSMLCFAEIWKDNLKLIFMKGAKLDDPKGLFNSRLKSRDVRAIEYCEEDVIDQDGVRDLVLEAIRLNSAK